MSRGITAEPLGMAPQGTLFVGLSAGATQQLGHSEWKLWLRFIRNREPFNKHAPRAHDIPGSAPGALTRLQRTEQPTHGGKWQAAGG